MKAGSSFYDTNVLLYLLTAEPAKAEAAEALLASGGHVSVQVLNEFAAVATRKLGLTWREVRDVLSTVRQVCAVEPLTTDTHDRAAGIAERYRLHLYDALIIASALLAGCERLYSEDLQSGQRFERRLKVVNPFLRIGPAGKARSAMPSPAIAPVLPDSRGSRRPA